MNTVQHPPSLLRMLAESAKARLKESPQSQISEIEMRVLIKSIESYRSHDIKEADDMIPRAAFSIIHKSIAKELTRDEFVDCGTALFRGIASRNDKIRRKQGIAYLESIVDAIDTITEVATG